VDSGKVVDRLRKIRKLREQRAMEAVTRQQRLAGEAQRNALCAAEALAARQEQAAAHEQAAFRDLAQQPLAAQSLLALRHRFQTTANEVEQLRRAAQEARAAEETERDRLARVHDERRAHLRSVEKLDRLSEDLAARGARRQEALEEMTVEEEVAFAAARKEGPQKA
jgi:hypothetical protein